MSDTILFLAEEKKDEDGRKIETETEANRVRKKRRNCSGKMYSGAVLYYKYNDSGEHMCYNIKRLRNKESSEKGKNYDESYAET